MISTGADIGDGSTVSPDGAQPRSAPFDESRIALALSAGGLVGLWDGDLKTGLVYGDANFARLYNLDPALVAAGMPRGAYSEFMHPDDLASVQADIDRMFAGADEFCNEHRITHPVEGVRWVLTRGHLVRDAAGQPTRFSGVSVNISARKKAEARQALLLDVSDRLRMLSDPDAILDKALAMLGEYLGASRVGYAQVQPDDVTILMEASYVSGVAPIKGSYPLDSFGAHHVETNRRGVTAFNNDVLDDPLCERRAWEMIDTRSFACAPMSRNGRLIAAIYVNFREPHVWDPEDVRLVEDVAARIWEAMERSRSEAALLTLNATLEQTVEQRTHERDRTWRLSPVLMIVGDENGKILQVNPAWNKDLGWTSEETVGRDIMEFVAPEDRAFGAAGMAQLSKGEPVVDYKLNMMAKDGRPRTIAWTTVPEADRLHAFGRDITAQMLAEDHLRQAQKMDALGQLTGGIAHDFNNLLQGVTGSLDLIRRQPADEAKVRRLAEAGLRAAERGSKLTSQLLAFSRAQELELQPVVISDLVVNMSDLFDRTLGPNIRVRLDLDPRHLAARCDPTQLEMAVLNLAINARDAMGGNGELTIGVRRVSVTGNPALVDGDYMEVSVRDTGSGMPPEIAERAFDPFFTTKGAGKGTGLGLSQVYGSAKHAGGGARIESRLGEGTTVRIFLPQTADLPTCGIESTLPLTLPSTGASTILVVDDDADVRAFLIASLRSLGFRTVEADDGHSGLAALDRWRPDAMILDFAMPGMTGAQVAAAARSRRPDFPIIFTSGYSDTAAISEIPGRPTPLLRKPFKVEDLEGVLVRALVAPSAG